MKVEGEIEERTTCYKQELEALQQKKAMRVVTLQSKLVFVLTIDDAMDMYSRDTTATFKKRRRLREKQSIVIM